MWDLPPLDPGLEIVVASRGMSKGVAQTNGPQVILKLFVQVGDVQAGGQWKNVTSPAADGEAAAFVNYAPKLGPYQLSLGAAYKFQTSVVGNPDDKSFEFNGNVSRKFGKLGVKGGAIYSPDDLGGTRRSLYLEGGASYDIDKTMRVSANLGRRSRIGSPDYTSFNAGIAKTFFSKFTIDARYYDTAQSALGDVYRARFVITGKLSL